MFFPCHIISVSCQSHTIKWNLSSIISAYLISISADVIFPSAYINSHKESDSSTPILRVDTNIKRREDRKSVV